MTDDFALRVMFERVANDSHGFKRSRKGTYVNPAVARDWKWFQLGARYISKDTEMIKPEVIQKAKDLAEAVQADAVKYDAAKTAAKNADVVTRLRNAIQDIRRKPYPISDLVPLLAAAADALEATNAGNCKNPIFSLTGYQLLRACDFTIPDVTTTNLKLSSDATDQLESTVCIQYKDAGLDMDGGDAPEGYYIWLEEYPEEGSFYLDK